MYTWNRRTADGVDMPPSNFSHRACAVDRLVYCCAATSRAAFEGIFVVIERGLRERRHALKTARWRRASQSVMLCCKICEFGRHLITFYSFAAINNRFCHLLSNRSFERTNRFLCFYLSKFIPSNCRIGKHCEAVLSYLDKYCFNFYL